MKNIIISTTTLLLIPFFAFSQMPTLDVDGVAQFNGRINVDDGGNSVFIGTFAGRFDDGTENDNVFVGFHAGWSNETGDNNVFTGRSSGFSNTSGNRNTFIGRSSGFYNATGNNNAFFGADAGFFNSSGIFNTFVGASSGLTNSSGTRNTFVGRSAGFSNSTGNNNTFLGMQAGDEVTTGSNLVVIGYNSSASSATATNEVTLGNDAITTLRCNQTSITSLSDRRDKKDIAPIVEGMDFISRLKPVTYVWNQRDGKRIGIPAAGFIAQDLLEAQESSPIGDYLDLVSTDNPDKLEARYGNLLPVMVKAIQEQQQTIDSQQAIIDAQGKKLAELENLVLSMLGEEEE